jgi:hypothetical protein
MTEKGLHQPDKNNKWAMVAISKFKSANQPRLHYTMFFSFAKYMCDVNVLPCASLVIST